MYRNASQSEGEIDHRVKGSRILLLIRSGCIAGETKAGFVKKPDTFLLLSPTTSVICCSFFNF